MKFKKGQRVILEFPLDSHMAEVWNGVRGTVISIDSVAFTMRPEGDKNNKRHWGAVAGFYHNNARLDVPLSPLEELIVRYVEAEKKELGI